MNTRAIGRHCAFVLLMIGSSTVFAQAKTVDPADAPADAVVAERGGVKLTVGDIDAKIRTMPSKLRARYMQTPEQMSRMVDTLLLTKQLAAEAERSGLADRADVAEDLALARAEVLSRAQIQAHLESRHETAVDELAHEIYLSNPDEYRPPERFDIYQVLVPTDGRDEQEAKALAQHILDDAKAGAKLETLSAKYLPDADGHTAGPLKNLDFSRVDPAFAAAVRGMQHSGELIGPVRSKFGYHVIRLDLREQRPAPSYDEVKPRIVERLRAQQRNDAQSSYLRELSERKIEFHDDVIATLPQRYQRIWGQDTQDRDGD